MMRAALLLTGATVSFLFGLIVEAVAAERGKALPQGFVYLKDIDPTIVQDVRYATPFNFTGARVPGYDAPECVLLREVAMALKAAQDELRAQNLGLKVYDCYRPRRAVRAFVDWVEKTGSKGDERHYPHTSRADLVKLGYISAVSSHSYGTAVDLTLIALPFKASQAEAGKSYGSCVAPKAEREPDESLDMGTGFDCFDTQSRNPALIDPAEFEAKGEAAPGDGRAEPAQIPGAAAREPRKSTETPDGAAPPLEIEKDQRDRRLQLFEVMKNHGFKGIRAEWWHYQYTRIARPLEPQDFVIPSRKTP
jgi:D-alanyl-D-alanine dipeptidase